MELLKVDSIDDAKFKLYNAYMEGDKGLEIEERRVLDALDFILAEKIVSSVAVPEFDRSVVDGYAVIASDTQGANDSIPTFLKANVVNSLTVCCIPVATT